MEYFKTNLSTLYCGDVLEELSKLASGVITKIITSPPYNIIRPNSTDRGYDLYKDRQLSNEEYAEWVVNIFNLFDQKLAKDSCVIWNMSYGCENTECMIRTINEIITKTNYTLADILVWKKQTATPNNVSANKMTRICEFVYVLCRRNEFMSFTANKKIIGYREDTQQAIYENVFNYFTAMNNDGSQELNKATFSEDFVKNLIDRYVSENDVVLDCFSGTGTTMATCESKGIKNIGIELSQAQCAYTKERISKPRQLSLI